MGRAQEQRTRVAVHSPEGERESAERLPTGSATGRNTYVDGKRLRHYFTKGTQVGKIGRFSKTKEGNGPGDSVERKEFVRVQSGKRKKVRRRKGE